MSQHVNKNSNHQKNAIILLTIKETFESENYCAFFNFVLLLASLIGFIGMGLFGNKYQEMPDLSGKLKRSGTNSKIIIYL